MYEEEYNPEEIKNLVYYSVSQYILAYYSVS